MKHAGFLGLVAAAAFGMPSIGFAQNVELEQIRRQLIELRNDYESRIKALEDQLRATEAVALKSPQTASQAVATAQEAASAAGPAESSALATAQQPAAESALNPGISLTLNGTWGRSNYDLTPQIIGFQGSGASEIIGRGPSLGESELFLSANIDPYFRGALLAALTPENQVEVEEAFFETLSLGGGFTLKGGRFFSGIGYWNSSHPAHLGLP